MSNQSHQRMARSCLWHVLQTGLSASVLAVVFQAFQPATDDSADLHERTDAHTCRACASSTPEARAVRDAYLISIGAIEVPNAGT